MTEQPALFDVPVAAPALTPRQQQVLDYIARNSDGVPADEAGALTHRHGLDARCDFCGKSGREVCGALVKKGYAKRRRGEGGRGVVYVPADAAGKRSTAPMPDDEIPF